MHSKDMNYSLKSLKNYIFTHTKYMLSSICLEMMKDVHPNEISDNIFSS